MPMVVQHVPKGRQRVSQDQCKDIQRHSVSDRGPSVFNRSTVGQAPSITSSEDSLNYEQTLADIPKTLQWAIREKQRSKLLAKCRTVAAIDIMLCVLATGFAVLDIELKSMRYGLSVLNMILPYQFTHSIEDLPSMRPACRATLLRTSRITPEQYLTSISKTEMNFTKNDLHDIYDIEYRLASAYNGTIDHEWREATSELENGMTFELSIFSNLIWFLITFITIMQICFHIEVCNYKTQLKNLDSVFLKPVSWASIAEVFRDSILLMIHYHPFIAISYEPYFIQLKLMVILKKFMLIPNRTRISSIIASRNYGTEKSGLTWNLLVPSFLTTEKLVTGLSWTMIIGWYLLFANEREYGTCIGPWESMVIVVKSLFGNTAFQSNSSMSNFIQILVLFNGFLFMAYMVDNFSRQRQFSLETRKLVASHEYRICTAITREAAAAVIQAMWKCHKSRLYLKWKQLQNEDFDERKRPVALHADVQAVLNTKLWNWRKIKRDTKSMQMALDFVLQTEFECPTVEEICCEMNESENLTKRQCKPMPYDFHDSTHWEEFNDFVQEQHIANKRLGRLSELDDKVKEGSTISKKRSSIAKGAAGILRRQSIFVGSHKITDLDGCKIISTKGHQINRDLLVHRPKVKSAINLTKNVQGTGSKPAADGKRLNVEAPVMRPNTGGTTDNENSTANGNSELLLLLRSVQSDMQKRFTHLENEIADMREEMKKSNA